MRITVISTPVFKLPCLGYSGLEHLAWQQAAGLAAKGHEVYLVAPDGSTCPGVNIVPIGPERSIDEKAAFRIYSGHLAKMDVIVDHSWVKWTLKLKQEGLKAPSLSVCHAPINTMFGSMPPNVEKPCFVCISKDQANHFEAIFSRQAKVAYNGIDLNFYKAMGLPRTNRFLFLARFSTIKGPDLALKACKEAGVGLDLVGDTTITQEPEYFKQCQAMCDGTILRMVGPASRGECVSWFNQAHCMIHANQRFREPFGLAPVEAMACGTPVIAWDYGAMRETVVPGKSGWLVRSYEELAQVVKELGSGPIDPGIRQSCREQAAKFTVARMIDRYEELCHEAIQTGGW
jgi:glycosyltransferase involved in cell wall biosynthesis